MKNSWSIPAALLLTIVCVFVSNTFLVPQFGYIITMAIALPLGLLVSSFVPLSSKGVISTRDQIFYGLIAAFLILQPILLVMSFVFESNS